MTDMARKARKILLSIDLDDRTRLLAVGKLQAYHRLMQQIYQDAELKYPPRLQELFTGQYEE
jgi:hypothetical protein